MILHLALPKKARLPIDGIAITLFLLCALFYTINGWFYWSFLMLGPIFLLIAVSFYGLIHIKISYSLIAYISFCIYVIFTALLSHDPIFPFKTVVPLVSICASMVAMSVLAGSTPRRRIALAGFVIAGLFGLLYIILTAGLVGYEYDFTAMPLGKNVIAVYLFTCFSSNILLLTGGGRGWLWASAVILFVGILPTLSLQAIVPSSLVLFSFIVSRIPKERISEWSIKGITSLILILLSIAIILWLIRDSLAFAIISSKIAALIGLTPAMGFAVSAQSYRTSLFFDGIRIFIDNPVFGVGLGNSRALLGIYTHNTWSEILSGAGIVGFLLFAFFFFGALLKLLTIYSFKERLVAVAIWIGIGAISMTQSIYEIPVVMIFFYLMNAPLVKLGKESGETLSQSP